MNAKTRQTAERFGILDKMESLENELLKIPGVSPDSLHDGIDFDLDGWYDDIPYVILVPGYDIPLDENYFDKRSDMLTRILRACAAADLHRTADPIEDYGAHYYIVTRCGERWTKTENREG